MGSEIPLKLSAKVVFTCLCALSWDETTEFPSDSPKDSRSLGSYRWDLSLPLVRAHSVQPRECHRHWSGRPSNRGGTHHAVLPSALNFCTSVLSAWDTPQPHCHPHPPELILIRPSDLNAKSPLLGKNSLTLPVRSAPSYDTDL